MSNRTDTPTLITTLRSIAECDPAYRDTATAAADRLEELAFALREHLREEFQSTMIPDTDGNLDKGVEFMASAARDTLNGGDNDKR